MALLAPLLLLAGCLPQARPTAEPSASQAVDQSAVVEAARPVAVEAEEGPEDYRLQVGDVLDVLFFYSQELNQKLVIRPDGRISLQLIGELQAAGLTTAELQQTVQERYTGILRRPEVSVIVTDFSAPKAWVSGEVLAPGEIVLSPGLTAFQAIARTGGFTPDAELENVVVLRYPNDRRPRFYALNLSAFLDQGVERSPPAFPLECETGPSSPMAPDEPSACPRFPDSMASDMRLKPFDIVYVPKTRVASVAEFFDRYINTIIPLYRNLGLTFTYELSDVDDRF